MHTLVVLLAVCAQVAPDEAAQKELLAPFYQRQAAAYELMLDAGGRLELQATPLITWTNAERYMGSVFIWTLEGRPQAIGCIGSENRSDGTYVVFHEMHALSSGPLSETVVLGGGRTWAPESGGLEWQSVEGSAPPAGNERQRLRQMREIARGFDAWMKDGEDVSELRLLSQPLQRYSNPNGGIVDGAIFSYVWQKGTDPEVLLVLEAIDDGSGPRWQFGFARFNWRDLWVNRDGAEVWRVGIFDGGVSSNPLRHAYFSGVVGTFTTEQVMEGSR
jgi:hypothetical protein